MSAATFHRTLLVVIAGIAPTTPAAFGNDGSGVVSHVSVVSDKVEDVSSLEAWKRAFIKPGMTEQQKALAVWETVVKFRHQDPPPNEFLTTEGNVHDPIKSFNVYGYGMCCCASANIEALARYAGLEARGWGITGHSVPEVKVGGQWSMLDASLINYFPKADGSIAGVEEVSRGINDWYAGHGEYRNNNDKLVQFMRGMGWKNGPAIMSQGRYDENGWLPAATHGWYSSIQEFGTPGNNFVYEYGAAVGYQVNIQLRAGERLTRNWSNKGLHINMDGGEAPGALTGVNGKDQLRYSPGFGDIAPGRVGNGTLEYELPLAKGDYRGGMLSVENIRDSAAGPQVSDASRSAEIVFRMPSSYVYLGGELTFVPTIGQGGSIGVFFSDNNGLDWNEIQRVTTSGLQRLDLKPLVFRRYDYRLKFALAGGGTGLKSVKVTHDVQHSQRALPALAQGENHIHFSTGPQEGTITMQGAINQQTPRKNLLYSDFHPTLENIDAKWLRPTAGKGHITFPIQTPGDITRLRIGVEYRARDPKDTWVFEGSFDGGKSWRNIGLCSGPYQGNTAYFVFSDLSAVSHSALVRISGQERNTAMLEDLRIDADYREPEGAVAPVKITYRWEEDGKPRQDVHITRGGEERYVIHCKERPLLKAVVLERQ